MIKNVFAGSNMENKIVNYCLSYIKAGKLPLMIGLAPFFLSKNKKKMEVFRARLNIGVHASLVHKYYKKKISINYGSIEKVTLNNPIWFMWLQGIENAPQLSKTNYRYLLSLFGSRVKLITSNNVFEYIELPSFILNKWKDAKISNTHFSDIIRLQLLSTYGGTWIDSTVVVKKEFIEELPKFEIPQTFKPGSDGQITPVSNWFIHANKENEFILRVRDLLFNYWENQDFAVDYFIFHHFLIIASKEKENYLENVYPMDNTLPHYLMIKMKTKKMSLNDIQQLFEKFDVMKFTNKHENTVENENYMKLIKVLERTVSHDNEYL